MSVYPLFEDSSYRVLLGVTARKTFDNTVRIKVCYTKASTLL